MSRFAVFGMTKTYARQRAERLRVRPNEKLTDYEARVAAEYERIWSASKPVKVSNLFDAPQFAADFIQIGSASGDLRDGIVKVHADTKKLSKKTGKPARKWTAWTGDAAA